jgi:ABC-type dipeptide/oligopeptide/nickel transport system permease subunit
MRVVDILLAVPRLPLLVLVAALAGAGVLTVTVPIGLLFWPPMARIIRSRTLSLRGRGVVESARGFGAGLPYLIRRHLLPALGPWGRSSSSRWPATPCCWRPAWPSSAWPTRPR